VRVVWRIDDERWEKRVCRRIIVGSRGGAR
jgi:hypothetical protein